jgi:hypothetical protein
LEVDAAKVRNLRRLPPRRECKHTKWCMKLSGLEGEEMLYLGFLAEPEAGIDSFGKGINRNPSANGVEVFLRNSGGTLNEDCKDNPR